MDKNEYVYCTLCKNFRVKRVFDEEDSLVPTCPYEKECDIYDCDDSMPYKNRPHYEPIENLNNL